MMNSNVYCINITNVCTLDEYTPAIHSGAACPARVYANAIITKVEERSERSHSPHSVTSSNQCVHLLDRVTNRCDKK